MFPLFSIGRRAFGAVGIAPVPLLSKKKKKRQEKKGLWHSCISSFSGFSCYPVMCFCLNYSILPLTDFLISLLFFRQWLEDALRENEPNSIFIFLVGTKKDLVVSKWQDTDMTDHR